MSKLPVPPGAGIVLKIRSEDSSEILGLVCAQDGVRLHTITDPEGSPGLPLTEDELRKLHTVIGTALDLWF